MLRSCDERVCVCVCLSVCPSTNSQFLPGLSYTFILKLLSYRLTRDMLMEMSSENVKMLSATLKINSSYLLLC